MSISKKILVILFLFVIISISIISSYAVEYFTYQMNFENGSSRSHLQTITYTGTNLSVTIPTGFDLTNYSDGGIFSGDTLSWGSGTDRDVNYTLDSPSNCTDNGQEGDRYFSNIEVDNSFFDRFVFACVPDNKIVDYKLEYGHGDANYLSLDDFISNETATLFNLIRVFNIGHYLDIDEPANDASINCTFEKFPVRTYGRMELNHSGDNMTGALLWDVIESGYWFRIGVLSQEVSGKAVGDSYNVSCTELTYNFVHERVNASFADVSLGVRNTYPFAITITPDSNKLTYNIQNIELYPTKDLFFRWNLDGGISRTEELNLLRPNETIKFDVGKQIMDGSTALKFTRSRYSEGDEGSDFARSIRQEQVMKAIREKIIKNPLKIIDLQKLAKEIVKTDATPDLYPAIVKLGLSVYKSPIRTTGISTLIYNPPISFLYDSQWVLMPVGDDFSKIALYIKDFLGAGVQ